ncbi:MAG: hypothetical protein JWP78_2990 [Mucilaginibacter sp.]|nr:hypothetical protein [Mucilaginibacter sp.]
MKKIVVGILKGGTTRTCCCTRGRYGCPARTHTPDFYIDESGFALRCQSFM